MNTKDLSARSVFWTVAKDLLYLLPLPAGEMLVHSFSQDRELHPSIEWFNRVLKCEAKELVSWISREGDEEDKQVYLNVLLWKQRHGIIKPSLRVNYEFTSFANAYHVHRYMVANGYEGILDAQRPPSFGLKKVSTGLSYLDEIGVLLDEFSNPLFSRESDDFGDLALLVGILGPRLSEYPRRDEVMQFTQYILEHHTDDERLSRLPEDVNFASFVWLLSDLKLDAKRTWPVYEQLAIRKRNRGVLSYPAFIVGLEMYGDRVREILDHLEIQGSTQMFLRLVDC